jgi:hypothetical protein
MQKVAPNSSSICLQVNQKRIHIILFCVVCPGTFFTNLFLQERLPTSPSNQKVVKALLKIIVSLRTNIVSASFSNVNIVWYSF